MSVRITIAVAGCMLVVAASSAAPAATYTWFNDSGGSFQTNANWHPNTGLPGASDTAQFGNPSGSYTVTFTGSVENTIAQFVRGWPTFSLMPGQVYTVSGTDGFVLGILSSATANLTISGGGTLSLSHSNSRTSGIGGNTGTTGNLVISGPGTTFTTNGNYCDIGIKGMGTLTVQDGASASIGPSFLGAASGGSGTITVTGTGSSLTMGAAAQIGGSGSGALSISSGATASIGANLLVSGSISAIGAINVNSGGTLALSGATIGNGSGTNGSLNVNSGGTLNSGGSLTIKQGGTATENGTWSQASGLVTVSGGTLNLAGGSLTAASAGTGITLTSGSVNVSGGDHSVLNLTRSGTGVLNLTGGSLTVSGVWDNGTSSQSINGSSPANSPQLILTGGSSTAGLAALAVGMTGPATVTVDSSSTLTTATGLAIGPQGTVNSNGLVVGDVSNGGVMSAGSAPGVLHTSGNYTQTAAGKLQLKLGGTTLGTQYDQLQVSGAATLGGALQVSLAGGFTPADADSYGVLNCGSVSGGFSMLQLPGLAAPMGWDISRLYTSGLLTATLYVPGDFDRDGQVTVGDISAMEGALADLNAYQETHGPAAGALTADQLRMIGDLNGDLLVTNADVQELINSLINNNVVIVSGGGSIEAVPEPTSLALLMLGSLIMLRWAGWSTKSALRPHVE
jgi:T5SS/PEP-CTERM-associated repeat protein